MRSARHAWYAAVPANGTPAVIKGAVEGKERVAKALSAAEVLEAEKQSKSVVVSDAGDIVTNEHLINNCARVRIQLSGDFVKVVAKDARNDLHCCAARAWGCRRSGCARAAM